jgi:hypothetical protein
MFTSANSINAFVVGVMTACVAGCASTGAAPTPSPGTKPAYCISYDEGSCIARCHGSNAASAALPACPPQCTPGNATEPPTCRVDAACEATREQMKTVEDHACIARCSSIPPECR